MSVPSLADLDGFEQMLTLPVAVIYKHSTRCAFSAWAQGEVARFVEHRADIPVGQVDVLFDRMLSLEIADRLGITHESPQAIVLRAGRVVWHGSHGAVKAAALHRAVAPSV